MYSERKENHKVNSGDLCPSLRILRISVYLQKSGLATNHKLELLAMGTDMEHGTHIYTAKGHLTQSIFHGAQSTLLFMHKAIEYPANSRYCM